MPDQNGQLLYSEAVAAGLYDLDESSADASLGLFTYAPKGPGLPPKFGATKTGPTVGRPAGT